MFAFFNDWSILTVWSPRASVRFRLCPTSALWKSTDVKSTGRGIGKPFDRCLVQVPSCLPTEQLFLRDVRISVETSSSWQPSRTVEKKRSDHLILTFFFLGTKRSLPAKSSCQQPQTKCFSSLATSLCLYDLTSL